MKDAVARLVPGRMQERLVQLLVFNGIDFRADRFIGSVISAILAVSCMAALLAMDAYGTRFMPVFLGISFLLCVSAYSFLVLRADGRGNFVESVLPDFLKLMSANLKAGLSVDRALMYAVRPEFGYFRDEIRLMAGRVVSGDSFEDALHKMGTRIRSESLHVTIDLIVQGMRSGGELSDALNRISDILADREYVKNEIRAGVQMYVTLIIFAIVVGTPLLFGISTFLVEVMDSMSNTIIGRVSSGGSAPPQVVAALSPSRMPFTIEAIRTFSVVSILSTSFLGSIIVGLINTGNWRRGLKYVPVFCTLSVGLFLAINRLLVTNIGGLFT
jgi:archaeal flagellar protein FlaJ